VDISNFKTHDWLRVGGGAAVLIAGFLPWLQFSAFGFSSSINAFDIFFTGTLPWLIFVAIGVLSFLAAAGIFKLPETLPVPTIFLGGAAAGTLLIVIRFFYTQELGRGIGLFLGLIGAVVATVGSVQYFQASGGDLAELGKSLQSKATNKSENGDEMTPPPPPPPAS
jgi:hypothetical protein